MSANDFVLGDYGQVLTVTVKDVDTDAAADVSAYTGTATLILVDPSANSTSVTAAFDDDGSDGLVTWTTSSAIIDEAGDWWVRARVTNSTAQLTSLPTLFRVVT